MSERIKIRTTTKSFKEFMYYELFFNNDKDAVEDYLNWTTEKEFNYGNLKEIAINDMKEYFEKTGKNKDFVESMLFKMRRWVIEEYVSSSKLDLTKDDDNIFI